MKRHRLIALFAAAASALLACASAPHANVGAFVAPMVQRSVTFTSSGTWTAPIDVNFVDAVGYGGTGGGGYGGGGFGTTGAGGGGGASARAGYPITVRLSVTGGTAYYVTVGQGGTGGAAPSTAPTDGTDSLFSTLGADGGAGTMLYAFLGGQAGAVANSAVSSAAPTQVFGTCSMRTASAGATTTVTAMVGGCGSSGGAGGSGSTHAAGGSVPSVTQGAYNFFAGSNLDAGLPVAFATGGTSGGSNGGGGGAGGNGGLLPIDPTVAQPAGGNGGNGCNTSCTAGSGGNGADASGGNGGAGGGGGGGCTGTCDAGLGGNGGNGSSARVVLYYWTAH